VQKFWSILFGGTMLGALLLFIAAPLVGWWLPKNVATFGAGIDWLFYLILAITGFFFVLTEAVLAIALWRFAARPGHKAVYQHGNHRLEVIWTVVPGVILLVLAIVQIKVWAEVKFQKNMPAANGKTQQMEVLAKQWEWRVRYPSSARMQEWEKNPDAAKDFDMNPHVDDIYLPNEIHIWNGPANDINRVLVHLKTEDVIHSFFLPNLRLKQDALPGKTISVWFAVTEHNTELDPKSSAAEPRWINNEVWELACAEFCGTRHAMMRGKLYVHKDKDDFLTWLKHAEAEQNRHKTEMASR
jgi:cytochrome c oxidase subunit II